MVIYSKEFVLICNTSIVFSDAASQQIAVMTHQAEFSKMAIEAAMDTLRLMATGQ